ncbi:hypothetical protein GQ43DRAFT_434478 [Delitschia confertaspora ATCC 74209]|uniref:Impact N-terminal domain-containing protein n=1 Tax=Delitschia confertaspora ATCC 74209 TaxID=1513339 RepID=A0A9P4MPR4_9PLEO|nr:hypothetical protein GQ43DRAFT_434478 [Delitschia confertaspora ATCC 74209]
MNAFHCLRVLPRTSSTTFAAIPLRASIQNVISLKSSTPATRAFSLLSARRPQLSQSSLPSNLPSPTPSTSQIPPSAETLDILPRISSHPGLAGLQIRCGPRDTFSPSHFVRKRRHGFLARLRSKNGRKILKRRLAKKRKNTKQNITIALPLGYFTSTLTYLQDHVTTEAPFSAKPPQTSHSLNLAIASTPSPRHPSTKPSHPSNHHASAKSMSFKRLHSPSPSPSLEIYRSQSIADTKSTFTAAYSPSLPFKALQSLPEFKTASHRIAAWRKLSRQRSLIPTTKVLYDTGHDDDGEKWGGKRLEHVMDEMGVTGSVVVARWYGGVNIGPIRFTHIETVAKDAIRNYLAFAQGEEGKREEQEAQKRRKVDEDGDEYEERKRLAETLKDRDQSIFVLRGLLVEKTAALKGEGSAGTVSPVKAMNYSKMPIVALRRVEVARDKSIAFILGEIDKTEEKLQQLMDETGVELNEEIVMDGGVERKGKMKVKEEEDGSKEKGERGEEDET